MQICSTTKKKINQKGVSLDPKSQTSKALNSFIHHVKNQGNQSSKESTKLVCILPMQSTTKEKSYADYGKDLNHGPKARYVDRIKMLKETRDELKTITQREMRKERQGG